MLLALRSLWEAASGAVAAVVTGTRRNPKIQRKLRRLARWSEAVAPAPRPKENVVIVGTPAVASPSIGRGRVAIGVVTMGQTVSALPSIGDGALHIGVELFDYELAALLAA